MEEELGSGESSLQNLTFEIQNYETQNQSDYKNYEEGPEIVYEIDLNMTKSTIMQMIEKTQNEGANMANSVTKKLAGIINELKEPFKKKDKNFEKLDLKFNIFLKLERIYRYIQKKHLPGNGSRIYQKRTKFS